MCNVIWSGWHEGGIADSWCLVTHNALGWESGHASSSQMDMPSLCQQPKEEGHYTEKAEDAGRLTVTSSGTQNGLTICSSFEKGAIISFSFFIIASTTYGSGFHLSATPKHLAAGSAVLTSEQFQQRL